MTKADPFTIKRIEKFIEDFRTKSGYLPTLKDFDAAGFDRKMLDALVRDEKLVQLYVTLTNGTVVKGYKIQI